MESGRSSEPSNETDGNNFSFSDDLFDSFRKERKIQADVIYTPRPIFENWFSTYTDLSSRKFYFNYLYWKNDYQRIIQEIQTDLAHFNDKCCVVRREMLDCLVRSLRKIGNLDLAVQFVTELVQLEIVDLGSRVLASECYFESGRLDEALVQISIYLKERPSVYQAWLLASKICYSFGDSEAASASLGRAKSIASRHAIVIDLEYSDTISDKKIPGEISNLLFPTNSLENELSAEGDSRSAMDL